MNSYDKINAGIAIVALVVILAGLLITKSTGWEMVGLIVCFVLVYLLGAMSMSAVFHKEQEEKKE